MKIGTVAIVGMGLIGGSLGQAWRRSGAAERVIGVVRRPEARSEVLAAEAADEATTDAASAASQADLCVLCTPVESIIPLALQIIPAMQPGALLTDVGSAKERICRTLWAAAGDSVTFVGGHPMAGTERGGLADADPYLFEQAAYVLCPPPDKDLDDWTLLRELVKTAGAHPIVLDPRTHDAIVAAVSHVPHLVAAALLHTAGGVEQEGAMHTFALAAGGFRDTTRIASSPPELWRDICIANKEMILRVLDRFGSELSEIREAVENEDADALQEYFRRAGGLRAQIPERSKGILSAVHEFTVQLLDRPGAIADVARLLGGKGINIIDIEILRVREGEGGTVRMAVETDEALDEAIALLQAHGFSCRRRQ